MTHILDSGCCVVTKLHGTESFFFLLEENNMRWTVRKPNLGLYSGAFKGYFTMSLLHTHKVHNRAASDSPPTSTHSPPHFLSPSLFFPRFPACVTGCIGVAMETNDALSVLWCWCRQSADVFSVNGQNNNILQGFPPLGQNQCLLYCCTLFYSILFYLF